MRGARKPGETKGCSQELAAWVEHALLDDLVRPQQHRLRDREPQRGRRLEIHGEVVPRRLHRGQIGGLSALDDSIDVSSCLAEPIVVAWAIRHQSAIANDEAKLLHCGNALYRRELDDSLTIHAREHVRHEEQRSRAASRHR